ncbi:Myomodulin neuropeptide [Nymphon striatum]|nr:Myomodulin neuropeptide [Nymphon striatum]
MSIVSRLLIVIEFGLWEVIELEKRMIGVIVCHSFAPNHLSSKHFKEITRITKKGGYLVFKIRERYTLNDELKGFQDDVNAEVREKRWEPVIKPFKAEAVPGQKGPDGYLYVLSIESFDILLDAFYGLKLPKDSRVLDLCSGTGRLGQLLYEKGGYENVDALDCSKKSLEFAKLNGHYRNIYHQFFTLDNRKEIPDGGYIILIDIQYTKRMMLFLVCHAFVPNHLSSKHFKEITRITKKGGYLVLMLRERYTLSDEFSGFQDDVNDEVREKRWEPVIKPFKAEAVPGQKGPDGYLYVHIHYIMKILVPEMEAKTDKYNASWRSIVLNGKVGETKVAETYDEIASIYDEVLPIDAFYILLDEFYGLKLPKDSRVLDLCCGTGRLGTLLYEKGGYENVDALDCSKKSLEFAKLNGHYRNIYHQFFTLDNRKELPDAIRKALASIGKHWQALASIGKHWQALASIGKHWQALASIGKHWQALASIGKHWQALASIGKHWQALASIGKHWQALASIGKHWQALASIGKHWQALASIGKHWQALASIGKHWQALFGLPPRQTIKQKYKIIRNSGYTTVYLHLVNSHRNNYLKKNQKKLQKSKETYDVVFACHCFVPNHLSSKHLKEITRITKKGGHVVLVIRERYTLSDEFSGFLDDVNTEVREKRWEPVIKSI